MTMSTLAFVAVASLLQAVLGDPVCQAGVAGSVCGGALVQRQRIVTRTKGTPAWWAPQERVDDHDHRYRVFVNTLLQNKVSCDGNHSFKVEAKTMDVQHEKLFSLIDQVRLFLKERQEKFGFDKGLKLTGPEFKPLKTLLQWLRQYTVVHFDAEERTMQLVNYMKLVGHKAAHRAFYGHVMMWNEIVDVMMEHGGTFHVGNVYVMVARWFHDHICVHDKEVSSFLEESGKKDIINDHHNTEGVDDAVPNCVPALVGEDDCAHVEGMAKETSKAPDWWAPDETLTAHDHWYRAFVNTLLQSPMVCELADSFDISVKTVDAQHHKLLTLVDRIRAMLLERQQRLGFDEGLKLTGEELEPLRQVLVWLHQYGVVHFDAEEETMRNVEFPDFVSHKAHHRGFYGQMMMSSEVTTNIMQYGAGFHVGPIFVYMGKWIQDHVCRLDKVVGKFIYKSGTSVNDTHDDIPDELPLIEVGDAHASTPSTPQQQGGVPQQQGGVPQQQGGVPQQQGGVPLQQGGATRSWSSLGSSMVAILSILKLAL